MFGPVHVGGAGSTSCSRSAATASSAAARSGARRDAEFWEAVWRGDIDVAREHARRTDDLFPKLWLPGGWGGHYGAYQSQLKVLMRLLGQPGGTTVRPPRLPVTDEASIAAMRDVLVEAGLLAQPAEVA